MHKFDSKSYEETFLGYSTTSKAYGVCNKYLVVEESKHIIFYELNVLHEIVKLFESFN